MGLFAGLGDTEVDRVQKSTQSTDTKETDKSPESTTPADTILNWWEITWRGYDGKVRTIECEIYQEWPPAVIGVHPWGNKQDFKGIPMDQIISKIKKPKPDPRELPKHWERK